LIPAQRIILERYLDLFKKLDMVLLEAADINDMYRLLKQYEEQDKPIHGFLIDLMLPQSRPNMNFTAWGVPSLSLNHAIGGAQVIKLMRHDHYKNLRNDPAHPLHIMQHYINSKIALFTTYEDGKTVMQHQGIANMCDFLYKDQVNIEEQLEQWIRTCNP
jgi:hypothetical protein